jgi:hypothetical protein
MGESRGDGLVEGPFQKSSLHVSPRKQILELLGKKQEVPGGQAVLSIDWSQGALFWPGPGTRLQYSQLGG